MLSQFIHRARWCTMLAADLIGAGAHVEGATQTVLDEPQLTATEALNRAETRHPLFAAWRARLAAARGRVVQATAAAWTERRAHAWQRRHRCALDGSGFGQFDDAAVTAVPPGSAAMRRRAPHFHSKALEFQP